MASMIGRILGRRFAAAATSIGPVELQNGLGPTIDAERLAVVDLLFVAETRAPKHIVTAATHMYSQNFEDSIIAEIFHRIGEKNRTFAEVGIDDGRECNTRLLLECGWRGVWIEGDPNKVELARQRMSVYLDNKNLTIVAAMATPDNIDSVIGSTIGTGQIDFLSIDVDYNTSHIWRACSTPARVSCIEYNASVPPMLAWEVPYDGERKWSGTNRFGASLKTLELIGRSKDMNLVGCDFHGVNAFFVNDLDCGEKFLRPYTAETHFTPPRFQLVGHRGHAAD